LVPRLDEFECQGHGHQGQKMAFSALSVACLRFMFGKTSLASGCCYFHLMAVFPGDASSATFSSGPPPCCPEENLWRIVECVFLQDGRPFCHPTIRAVVWLTFLHPPPNPWQKGLCFLYAGCPVELSRLHLNQRVDCFLDDCPPPCSIFS